MLTHMSRYIQYTHICVITNMPKYIIHTYMCKAIK